MTRRVAMLLLSSLVVSVRAQETPPVIPPADLAAFVDGMVDIQMKRDDAAGVDVLMRQDGRTLLSRGYGSADVARHVPMSAASTIVRGGALAMPVIAVAVMQQVEQGRVTLDEDISGYLDFILAGKPRGVITLRHLLTHTAGFAGTPPILPGMSLGAYVKAQQPVRIFPAGAVNAYSPYGMDLAAYLVERVSGEPFAEYARRHIFQPLGMTRTSLAENLPAEMQAALSQGYGPSTQPPLVPETLDLARNLSTTAEDMGRFGTMLVESGAAGTVRVLRAASVTMMLSRQRAVTPDLPREIPAMALAFHQLWFNGSRLLGQSGDTAAFHAELEVDPERKLVVFIAYNSSGHAGVAGERSKLTIYSRGELIHGIFDRYQPFHPKVVNRSASTDAERLVTGTWTPADQAALPLAQRRPMHTKLEGAERDLVVDRFLSDRDTVKHWKLLADDVWQQYPQDRMVVLRGRDGLPDRLATAADPANQWVRVVTSAAGR